MSLAHIRTATNYRSHTIRYAIQQMEQAGIIKKAPFINVYSIGYQDYAVYFSLSANTERTRSSFLQGLVDSPNVSWLAEIGGDYQYAVALYVRTPDEVATIFDTLTEKSALTFFQKSIHVRTLFVQYNRKYLGAKPRELSFGFTSSPYKMTDVDQMILRAISKDVDSIRSVSIHLNVPLTSIHNRIGRLRKAGVIQGMFYQVNAEKISKQTFELLIYARGFSATVRAAIRDFAKRHPLVVHYVEGIGEWDMELGVEVDHASDAVRVQQEIYDRFGDHILQVKMLPLFQNLKYSLYPFALAS